jgi:hypothetical protein
MNKCKYLKSFAALFALTLAVSGCSAQSSKNGSYHGSSQEVKKTDSSNTSKQKNNDASGVEGKNSDASVDLNWKELITKAEVESILGEPAGEAEFKDTKNPLGQRIIFWPTANEMKLSYVQVSLITTDGLASQLKESGHDAKKQFEVEKAVLKNVEKVEGIGDDAYWDPSSPLISGLHVLKGDNSLTVMINSKDKDTKLEAEKDLALKILERLPQ